MKWRARRTGAGSPDPSGLDWFIAYTSPQGERLAKEDLEEYGIHAFLPQETAILRPAKHRRDRRRKTVQRPLFPRYLFVGIAPRLREFDLILRSKRILEVLSDASGRPVMIAPRVIEGLMSEIEHGRYDAARIRAAKLAALLGVRIDITGGPFEGMFGTVTRVTKKSVRMEVRASGATLPIEVPLADLERSGLYSLQDDRHKQSASHGVG